MTTTGLPHASSSIIISSRALLNEAEVAVFFTKHAQYGIVGRIATTALSWQLNELLAVVNHEVNGHGFRLRSLGIPVTLYSFTLPLGGEETHFQLNRMLLLDERLLIDMGGVEANCVLAQKLLLKNFQRLLLDSRTVQLFTIAYWYLMDYILSTYASRTVPHKPGSDYDAKEMHPDKRAKGSLVFLLNPILYIAFLSRLVYLKAGKNIFTIPHLNLGKISAICL